MTPETIAAGWILIAVSLIGLGVAVIRAALADRKNR